MGFLPLFGGPGYEQSLASGLIVPSAAAIATASMSSRDDLPVPLPIAAVGRGVASGLVLGALAFGTALVHGLRVGMCDLVGGRRELRRSTALLGSVLGGVWGAVVAEVARGLPRRVLVSVLGALALPLGSALVSVARFYTSPMIFAFDPFVGYFSGTLYDTVIDAGTALLTYRTGSLATLVAVALVASVLTRDPERRLRLVQIRGGHATGTRARAALAVVAQRRASSSRANGPRSGHWETCGTIAADLGGARSGRAVRRRVSRRRSCRTRRLSWSRTATSSSWRWSARWAGRGPSGSARSSSGTRTTRSA